MIQFAGSVVSVVLSRAALAANTGYRIFIPAGAILDASGVCVLLLCCFSVVVLFCCLPAAARLLAICGGGGFGSL